MIVIPAIDIKQGLCVRLKQGQMSRETVYSRVPGEMARKWYQEGAERLHLVDLDGAVKGKPVKQGHHKKYCQCGADSYPAWWRNQESGSH